MNDHGFRVWDPSGSLLLDSNRIDGVFFSHSGTFLANAPVAAEGFASMLGIATPTQPATVYNSTGATIATGRADFTCTGVVTAAGYREATAVRLISTHPASFQVNVARAVAYVHAFGTPPPPAGYGMFAPGKSGGGVAVDSTRRLFQLHPTPEGHRIRTAVASSIPSPASGGVNQHTTSFQQPTTATIHFDMEYENPPLIFVTRSTGPVALSYMNQAGNGKYASASIVACGRLATPGDYIFGTAFYASNSFGFDYFIVSDEDATYLPADNIGVRIYTGAGKKSFDSRLFCPHFDAVPVSAPYMWRTTGAYTRNNTATMSLPPNYGVCINNLSPIVSMGAYGAANAMTIVGPQSVFGRYLTVNQGMATVSGEGSFSRLRTALHYSGGVFSGDVTHSYMLDGSYAATLPILTAAYAY